MALILYFPRVERKPSARQTIARPANGADILFFTGVRYSRHDGSSNGNGGDVAASRPGRRQTGRRRKAS